MKIRFWGVRGSIPPPGANTVRYGGNTTCIEVRTDSGALIILDAGTTLIPGEHANAHQTRDAAAPEIHFVAPSR